jgi:GTP pyrophosphokinase
MRIESLLESHKDLYSLTDRELIQRAYRVAEKAHEGQKRASGEPYVNHCLAVASILAELRVPPQVVAAGLLHDTVEDTDITLDDIRRDFGEEIAILVDAVTKLTTLPRVSRSDQHAGRDGDDDEQIDLSQNNQQRSIAQRTKVQPLKRGWRSELASENLRKTFLAMAEDPRVVLIKLADRLHNMRTLNHMPSQKQIRIAQETMDVFAPLASRLGIWQMKWELEDLSFRYLNPSKFLAIAQNIDERRSVREREVDGIIKHLKRVMSEAGMDAEISGRPKHIYSIFRKMQRKDVAFDMVHDVRGVRILVPDKADCYTALGIIHSQWRPIPGEFDDYIAAPKDNFYRSLHTAVIYDDGKTLEIQIRTPEMHQNAEYGIAAHWRYKEGPLRDPEFERRVMYLRQLMEWRQDVEDAQEFMAGMKTDVFGDRVYVFTPRGDIIDLPEGATPIDFAYHVHTEVGHRCRGAKVNGKLVSLEYTLKTGDQVEILTAKRGGPSRDWINPHLGLVKTQRARSKIRRWFKRQARDQNISHGKDLFERELRQLGLSGIDIEDLTDRFDFRNEDDLFAAIGCGDISLGRVVNELVLEEEEEDDFDFPSAPPPQITAPSTDDISVLGLKGLLSRMARCCNPTPGDEIIGYITRGRGATIHRKDCPNVLRIRDTERLVKVSWGEPANTFPVPIRVKAYDRDGLMKDVSTLIADEGINMNKVRVDVRRNMALFDLILEVRDVEHLSRVLDRLERLPNVFEARRVRPG